jgi:hypothetical protein
MAVSAEQRTGRNGCFWRAFSSAIAFDRSASPGRRGGVLEMAEQDLGGPALECRLLLAKLLVVSAAVCQEVRQRLTEAYGRGLLRKQERALGSPPNKRLHRPTRKFA